MKWWTKISAISVIALMACNPGGGGDGPDRGDAGPQPDGGPMAGVCSSDRDGDGIDDSYEGTEDADGDGVANRDDDDSDGDDIPDEVERGGPGCLPPADSDGDGTPDFLDLDSDGNGLPDADEWTADRDADGIPDFQDDDNDGDRIPDSIEIVDPANPQDYDGDGLPDYVDPDSDDDTIGDAEESTVDTDGDGTPDRFDLDSDEDSLPDSQEAGDADLNTFAIDTDGDGIADFRDPDSDADGIGDRAEAMNGTDPRNADSDGDGASDLIETSAGTDPLDAADNPQANGDFVFVMPFEDTPMPERDTLDFATNIRNADVYFLMDTTGSMGSSITSLQAAIRDSLIPGIQAEISNTQFGIGEFRDYGISPYGSGGDQPYTNFQDITGDIAAAQAATSSYTPRGGNDGPESHGQAFYAVATGNGLPYPGSSVGARTGCPAGTHGWPCFRDDAVSIVVMITDIYWHNGPGDAYAYTNITGEPSYAQVVASAIDNNVKMIGIGQGTLGMAHMEQFGRDIGSVDMSGNPFVQTFGGGGAAFTTAVVNQVRALASQTPLDISTVFTDDAADSVDTSTAFLERLEANEAGDPARGCAPRTGEDTTGDGFPDIFRDVLPGNRVCFDVIVHENTTVEPTTEPQLFRATVQVLGDGFTPLDERDVYFLVPPEVEIVVPI
ncbi:MAG: hypothetical protein JJ863_38305 [Deltaproteobacteria bacterium]|nr:hypothetical protein [Deltaproteobacteria bacterium]